VCVVIDRPITGAPRCNDATTSLDFHEWLAGLTNRPEKDTT
jgi:hypothetical protein